MRSYLIVLLMLFCYCFVFPQNNITISSITIKGNKITKEDVIFREITFAKNNSYSISDLQNRIEESKENLINLKLFNFVEIQHAINKNKVNIIIDLVERWYFWPYPILEVSERNFNSWWNEFKASNYSDLSRLNYGVYLNWENFRGRNEFIQIKLRKGFKEHYLIAYKIPYFNKKKTIGFKTRFQLFRRKKSFYKTQNNTLIYYTSNDAFSTKDYEFNTEILYRRGIHKTHKLKFNFFKTEIVDSIFILNADYLSNNSLSGSYTKLTYSFTNENRDYIKYPLHGYYLSLECSKHFSGTSPVNHYEVIGKAEKHIELKNRFFLGSSFKGRLASRINQPYFSQRGFGFSDYIRGYEYYVIDGQDFYLSKTILKYRLVEKTKFDIPYVKMKQFKTSHYSLYLGVFSDTGYIIDNQSSKNNNLSNSLLWGNGISLDYVTYYDKLLRIEFSVNHLGEKGVFLHFSNPF